MLRALVATVAASLAGGVFAQPGPCMPERGATRAQGGGYTVHFVASPSPVVDRHFTLNFTVCAADRTASPEEILVDARMPSHGHGMNYRPTITNLGNGRYRAEGLMFHMSGRWELAFVVKEAGATRKIIHVLVLK